MPQTRLAFGTFEFDPPSGELRKRGLRLKLQAKPAAVLSILLRHAPEMVSREQLWNEVWGADTFGDFEHGLGIAIWKLRQRFGDSAENPRFIETISGKGYRFIAPVRSPMKDLSTARKLIAIAPFEDLGKKTSQDYFVAGLTEELITQLGRVNPSCLGVITLRGKSLEGIPPQLEVQYLVTGTVRRDRTRLRVTAHLLDTRDQGQLWAGSYDRRTRDVISVQVDLAEQIAKSLAVELSPKRKKLGARKWTESLEAYELYLQGRYHWNKRIPNAAVTAIEYFQRAVSADPEYALAHVGLADCYAVLGFYGDLAPKEAFNRAKQHARKALALDDSLAEAHSSLAFCLVQFDWDWSAAQHEHLEAIQLNPNCAPAHHWYGLTLTQAGRFADALKSLNRAKDLDPFNPAIQGHIGRLSYFCRDFERSLGEFQRTVEIDRAYAPGRYFQAITMVQNGNVKKALEQLEELLSQFYEHPIPLSGLAYAHGKAGKRTAAMNAIERLHKLSGSLRVPPYFLAFAQAGIEHSDSALEYLEQACVERFPWLHYLKMDPVFDFLRANPRFNELVERIA